MNLRSEEFDALVEDLVKSLDKFKVPAREKGELPLALEQVGGRTTRSCRPMSCGGVPR